MLVCEIRFAASLAGYCIDSSVEALGADDGGGTVGGCVWSTSEPLDPIPKTRPVFFSYRLGLKLLLLKAATHAVDEAPSSCDVDCETHSSSIFWYVS
ncbi:UNVERIFIED_CONTAM: hypothetical protein Sindi_1425800 [Sesamum indicum]